MTRSRINLAVKRSGSESRWASLSAARLFLKKQLWVWPLLAAAMLLAVGVWLRDAMDHSLKASLENQLQVVLDADVAALTEWFHMQESTATAAGRDNDVVAATHTMLEFAATAESPLALATSKPLAELKEALAPWMEVGSYQDFMVVDPELVVIAADRDELLGKTITGPYEPLGKRVLIGESLVSRPFRSVVLLTDAEGVDRVGVPTMFVCAPIRSGGDGKILAALAFRLRPEDEFTSVLQLARLGEHGETFAFDKTGLLLSQSRFDDDLKTLGLLPDASDARSTLALELRDPGVDLTRGKRPTVNRRELPLIFPVQAAIEGTTGVNVEGYRDYRGKLQVGAWKWLDKYGMGIAVVMDYYEAMAAETMVGFAFWTMFMLLVGTSLAIFGFSFVYARMQQRLQSETLKGQRLGQYQLEEKLGEGGMGAVYRGRHALLRRPTAIKLLDVQRTNEASIARFEREVQLTSQLNHPNTIAIYDYGQTPEGIFYYAMECLEGVDLERLVERYGPLPEGRVIHLLLQICGSLSEAHTLGLVHRDIKPANLFVGNRGGIGDFLKVLDFGLVKAVDVERAKSLTAANAITGTPMYIAPEGIERPEEVDARSDLYAVGAVGYFLVTGYTPLDAANVVELCMKVVNTEPLRPSERLGQPISPALEAVLMRCLAKKPADRFSSADVLATALRECPEYGTWTETDSIAWWQKHAAGTFKQSATPTPASAVHSQTTIWTQPEPS